MKVMTQEKMGKVGTEEDEEMAVQAQGRANTKNYEIQWQHVLFTTIYTFFKSFQIPIWPFMRLSYHISRLGCLFAHNAS